MTFTAINLNALPRPQIIEQPTFEEIFAARKARLIELAPDLAPVLEYDSEPLVVLLQEDSYRELLLRQAVQDAATGNMLAYAAGAQLDHLAAFYGVGRQVVQDADPDAIPPVTEVLESDDALRSRAQLALEGQTTAGPRGSYVFWARSASGDVRDVSVTSPAPGEVLVTVLSHQSDGSPSAEVLAAVDNTLNAEDVRPLTDTVLVEAAAITSDL